MSQSRPYDAVVFDLDGTLVNTSALHIDATQAAARAILGRDIPPDLINRSLGHPLLESLKIIADGCEERRDDLAREFMRYYTSHERDGARCFPDVYNILECLQSAGISLALLSNKLRRWGQEEIARLGLTSYFTCVVFMEDMPSPKPSGLALTPILKALGLSAKRVVLIGDGVTDIACAQSAGAASAAAFWGAHDPDALYRAHPTHTLMQITDVLALVGLAAG
jgi:phosphoglycolate phosphatase-like HAD superfamily hydrolase